MLLCNITHNLSFADAQLLVKFLMKFILDSVSSTTLKVLRHDNDVEAESKTRYKVLRAVKIQRNDFDSEKSLFDFRLVSEASGKPSDGFLLTPQGAPGRPVAGGFAPSK